MAELLLKRKNGTKYRVSWQDAPDTFWAEDLPYFHGPQTASTQGLDLKYLGKSRKNSDYKRQYRKDYVDGDVTVYVEV